MRIKVLAIDHQKESKLVIKLLISQINLQKLNVNKDTQYEMTLIFEDTTEAVWGTRVIVHLRY